MIRRSALLPSAIVAAAVATFSATAASAPATASAPAKPAAQQAKARLASTLSTHLGDRSAGSYLDRATGRLMVDVTDGSAAQRVRAAGATPRMVPRGRAVLTRATRALGRSARIPGTSWAIDPVSDQVVIQADESVKGAKLARLTSVARSLGSAARIQPMRGRLTTLGPTMLDGTAIYTAAGRCSLGYNVFSGAEHYFITAGHCTHAGSTWFADQGLTSRLGSSAGQADVFGAGGDYGIVHYDTAGIHAYGTVAGSGKFITSAGTPVVGLNIRRSGSSTGVQRGFITALNVTVTYPGPVTVPGLIQTSACSAPGDSGGPLYDGGSIGLGMLSGGNGDCSNGGQTVYQPLAPVLNNFGLTLWDTPQP